ncbi:3-hydroxyacyl-CoA dehydrogenase NAD-binding domain-containing protein [Caldimonas tepidiphila]|uniref:3-hydroxyacyl-CoA dehydrogenase NAD-binding domain-containing protein n=1 Tax=Caldimonas tepidiphila TaxID=2315841 RepID=UPI000E5BBFBF|nr:3-hydroxyacyl-CoA dehydrogenase NAD-binding domain-containing protein [Caldimonas tepidiphila]
MTARYEVHGRIAVITLDRPPSNGLGPALRRALAAALARAEDDAAVAAVVLTGAGRGFSGGTDLREIDAPSREPAPRLPELVAALEQCDKPVVAALHGVCAGGGLELALGCHYRVAAPGTTLALPELRVGLVPGAGGTQRLPRAIGVEPALQMILSGDPQRVEVLAALPGQRLIDRLVEGEPLAGALAFADEVAGQRPLPRLREREATHPCPEAYFRFAHHTLAAREPRLPAPPKAIDCIAAAVTRRFDEGLAIEREAFRQLAASPESRALRHAFLAERAVNRIPEVPEHTPVRPVCKAAVIGAGARGSGIALALLNAGLPVVLLDTRPEALERSGAAIREHCEALVRRGRLRAAELEPRLALLRGTVSDAEIRDADLVIEAVAEEPGAKRQVFARLDEVMKPGAILASASSAPLLDAVAELTRRPQDVVGLHFFGPLPGGRLLEVVQGRHTAPDVLATVMRLAQRLRRTAVVCGVGPGFIARRLAEALRHEAAVLLAAGCEAAQVDRAAERYGFPAGPCRAAAQAGEPIEVAASAAAGGCPDEAEIAERLVLAMADEGARLLEEGVALRASDIDLVCLTALGFPLWRGGPLWQADAAGLLDVVRRLRRWRRGASGALGAEPAPLLQRLAAEGGSFH